MIDNKFLDAISSIPQIVKSIPSLGIASGMSGDPTKKNLPQDDSTRFSNWAGTTDTKVMAKDLMDKGLINANQLYFDNPNPNDPNSVKDSQGDWKVAAIQKILQKAYQKNIRNPSEFMNNKGYLMSGLDPRIQDALKNNTFNQIHPNFWNVIADKILPQRWSQWDAINNKTAQK